MQWISVKDRLPEEWISVLVRFNDSTVESTFTAFINDDTQWCLNGGAGIRVLQPALITHWMPLPEPPKE